MWFLRSILRLAVFLPFSMLVELVWILGWLPARVAGRGEAWRGGCFRFWSRFCLFLFGVKVDLRGEVPTAAGLVVSNHLSYLDVVLMAAHMPCAFVAKSEVRAWPVIGLLAASMGTVFVDRGNKRDILRVTKILEKRIAAGQTVVVFPEGTSSAGNEILPFRPPLLDPFARMGLPVRYAALRYQTGPGDPPAGTSVAWWGEMEFPSHFFRLLGLSEIEARLVFGPAGLKAPDRKLLAARLEEAVATCFEPMQA